MLILAINTASSRTGIALLEDTGRSCEILGEESWPANNDEAEKLMPAIAKLMKYPTTKSGDVSSAKQNSAGPISAKQIYVIKGPGSFTGLRIGVTVANTMAYLTGAELFGLSTFEYWHSVSDLPVLVYAGKGGVYLSENFKSIPEVINLPDLNHQLASKKITKVTGDISSDQVAVLQNIKFIKSKKSFGQIMATILERQRTHGIIEKNPQEAILQPVKIIQPLYIKEPGITQSKKIANQSQQQNATKAN